MSIATRTPMDKLKGELDGMKSQFVAALPSHINPDKFRNVILTVCTQEPGLLTADRRSLLVAALKCAADGLLPDKREAAFVIFKSKSGVLVQYMPMIFGILKRMRNSKEIASFQAHMIYANDEFVIERGVADTLVHKPKFPGPRGAAIGAYAVAKFKDGSDPQFEVMDIEQINKVKAASRTSNGGPWVSWFDEMARKTVARRLAKWLPMDSEVEQVMRRDEEGIEVMGQFSELPEGIAIEDDRAPSKLDALEDATSFDHQTGEILEPEKVPAGGQDDIFPGDRPLRS